MKRTRKPKSDIVKRALNLFSELDLIESDDEKIIIINKIKMLLHRKSPFHNEPVDCVLWKKQSTVIANDYNPNKVAPPEMKLLQHSIEADRYTQPIVTWKNKELLFEVVDGFHRNRLGKESEEIRTRIKDHLPIVLIKSERANRNDRIAATIRHNRARGKHTVDGMSEIVIELKNRNWTNNRIGRELGMDEDEILRLCQITGLESLFKDADFSRSWEIDDMNIEEDVLTDEIEDWEKEKHGFRTTNTDDIFRIFHTYEKWECYKAGFYNTTKEGMTKEECEQEYCNFLQDEKQFRKALQHIINNWKNSCEHYLTNKSMNRIAYLGQASLCYAKQIPATFRGGFNLLSEKQQTKANKIALEYLNKWLVKNGLEELTIEEALLIDRQVDIY